jgi:hypothetical protein
MWIVLGVGVLLALAFESLWVLAIAVVASVVAPRIARHVQRR